MVFRVSPHRHSQSLSRDVPSTIRLPSAIVPENDDEKDDIEKSTKKEIEEDLNIFCRRRLKSCRAFFLPFWCSQKSFFFSRARERRRDVCDSLRRSTQLSTLIYTLHTRVCYNKSNDKMTTILAFLVQSEVLLLFSCAKGVWRDVCRFFVSLFVFDKRCAIVFFLPRKREEKRRKKSKKKKKIIIIERKVQKSSQITNISSNFSTRFPLLEKLDLLTCSSQQQTTLEDQNPHTTYIIKKNFLLSVARTK